MPVSYNQSGYVGSSMSVRAAGAYANGEMPESKWSKKAMLAAIDDWCVGNDMVPALDFSKLRKDDLFKRYFHCSSWHHTSKYANATDFYSISEEALSEDCAMLSAELAAVAEAAAAGLEEGYRAECDAFWERWRHARQIERSIGLQAKEEYREERGFPSDSAAAFVAAHPDRVRTRVSKAGNTVYEIQAWRTMTVAERDLRKATVFGFDALEDALSEEDRRELGDYRFARRPKRPSAADILDAKRAAIAAVQGKEREDARREYPEPVL